jgi:hypothetical protein
MSASPRTKRNSESQRDRDVKTSPAFDPAELADRRELEKTVAWTSSERLRCLWYRLRLTIAEMNYATRRLTEQQMRLP